MNQVYQKSSNTLLIFSRITIIAAFLPQLFIVPLGVFSLTAYRVAVFLNLLCYIFEKIPKNKLKVTTTRDIRNLAIVWIAIAILSLFWCSDLTNGIKTITYLIFAFIGIYLVLQAHHSYKDIFGTIKLLLLVLAFHMILGLYEANTGRYYFIILEQRISWYVQQRYPISMFYNTNNFALLCFFSFMLSTLLLLYHNNKISKLFYFGIMLCSIYLMSITGSRAAFLAFILGGIVFLFSYYKTLSNSKQFLNMGIFILILTVLFTYKSDLFPALFGSTVSKISEIETDVRFELIKNGLLFLKQTFGFGIGAGSSEFWLRYYSVYDVGKIYIWHNWWLEVLVEYGLIVFLYYINIYCKNIRSFYGMVKDKTIRDPQATLLSITMLSIAIGFIVAVTGSSSLINTQWVWMIFALMLCVRNINEVSNSEKNRHTY